MDYPKLVITGTRTKATIELHFHGLEIVYAKFPENTSVIIRGIEYNRFRGDICYRRGDVNPGWAFNVAGGYMSLQRRDWLQTKEESTPYARQAIKDDVLEFMNNSARKRLIDAFDRVGLLVRKKNDLVRLIEEAKDLMKQADEKASMAEAMKIEITRLELQVASEAIDVANGLAKADPVQDLEPDSFFARKP